MKKLLIVLSLLATAFVPECGPERPYRFVSLGRVTVTSYQAVEQQTDASPFITADGTDLRETTNEQICAVSQDMLWFRGGVVRWGDTLVLYIPDYPEGPVVRCVVRDAMAPEIYRNGELVPLVRHVDLLTETYGRWTGRALLIRRRQ